MFKRFLTSIKPNDGSSASHQVPTTENHQILDDVLLSPITSADSNVLQELSQNELNFIENDNESPILLSPITSIESYNYNNYNQEICDIPFTDSTDTSYVPYNSITDLPTEILMHIIELVYYDTEDFDSFNKLIENFTKVRLISKLFNVLSLKYLYKYANFDRPHSFQGFLSNLNNDINLGPFVQVIDFESFTSIGLGRTGKMNQEIQMVTSKTILDCLERTPNLMEFLASESIQDDLDVNVLNVLFNKTMNLQALDFCGASSNNFLMAFNNLTIEKPLKKLFKISFHDCSNLTIETFKKILPNLINLRRLDLTHTSITSTVLCQYLPKSCNITHLSLSRCSKLTTKDMIHFLVNHPAVSKNQLQWLNLSVETNVVSPLDENYLFFTLKHMNASDLQYLNLKGLPINSRILNLINFKFKNLTTLSIAYSNVDFDSILEFLTLSPVKHIDLTGCNLNKSQILTVLQTCDLLSVEYNTKILQDLTNNNGQYKSLMVNDKLQVWRYYDNNGRRSWVYKLDEESLAYQQIVQYGKILNLNLTYYDLETGEKKVSKVTKPTFPKYVGKKINCSIGFENIELSKHKAYLNNCDMEPVWPPLYSERGIYNYYSLNI